MVERGSRVQILRKNPTGFKIQDSLPLLTQRQSLPSDCPFQYRELRWCQTNNTQNELLEVEKPTPKAKSRSYRFRW